MSDRRLDPTTLPGFRSGGTPKADRCGEDTSYERWGNDLVIEWCADDVEHYVPADFKLPLDILTEEQVIEILKRNGCPVPGGAE